MGTLSDIRIVERIGWVTLALPWFPISVLVSYALIAWFQVGHFPSPGAPNPKNIGMAASYVLPTTLYLATYLWIFSNLSLVFLLVSGIQRRNALRNIAIILVANAFYIGFMDGDPLGLLSWIGD